MSGCFEVFSSSFDGHQYQFVLEAVCRLSAKSGHWAPLIVTSAKRPKQTYERRIILLYFAAKTLQHQLPLSVGHVPFAVISVDRKNWF